MSLMIETGLFLLDEFTDCHAILGVPVEADFKVIRKRYLKIAQRLHPDSFVDSSQEERDLGTQIFAKLVGPAYNTLAKERERKEYLLLIGLKGKQAIQQRTSITGFSELAKQLANSSSWQEDYPRAVERLAEQQYENLQQCLVITGQMSELNLVYLMRREAGGTKPAVSVSTPTASSASTTSQPEAAPPPPPRPPGMRPTVVEGYLRRAEEYLAKKAYAQAVLELRDALNLAPKDSRCHSLMGMIYLQQNQLTMAKVSIKRALELNPQDSAALKAKIQLERLGQSFEIKPSGSGGGTTARSSGKEPPKDKGSGGLFGLFGGKKK